MAIKLPEVLSYERKLETSDALMFAGNWGKDPSANTDWSPIAVNPRKNRGTKSSYGHRKKPEKLAEANLVEGDTASLPHDKDTLKVSFNLRIIGDISKPFSCGDPSFEDTIIQKMTAYKEGNGLKTLAERYAYNIANGRFLWKNRANVDKILIKVRTDKNKSMTFNGYEFSLNNFEEEKDNPDLIKLKEIIYAGLNGDCCTFSFIEVVAYVRFGKGMDVFPSQEMNTGEKKKVLFKLAVDGRDCAAIHSVKIGNAIRTIDNWYNNAKFPIAVEPYGSVPQIGQAFRKTEKEGDFYSLMLDWLNEKTVNDNDKNFIVANLIRGGVFGGKSDQ